MTYLVSNIYGRYDRFQKLLTKLHFGDNDIMYVLGNIVDHGEQPMELVGDLSTRYNIYCVLGEHDYKAYVLLNEFDSILKSGGAPSPEFASSMIEWARDGGQTTLEAFKSADADTREGFLEFLSDLPVFEEATSKNKDYILVCRGINGFSSAKDPYDYELEDFLGGSMELEREYYSDKIMVAGYLDYEHTPAGRAGKVSSHGNNIALACDMSENDDIVCICLETNEEYYI